MSICTYICVCVYIYTCMCVCTYVSIYCVLKQYWSHDPLTAAQYTVHNRGEGIVALQNVQIPNHWIAIKNGQTVGTVSDVIMMSFYITCSLG